jgi:Autotransporter beta-domain
MGLMTANRPCAIVARDEALNGMRDAMGGLLPTLMGLATAAVFALGATGANAEGLGDREHVKDRPYAAPTHVWTGLHVGTAVGYGTGTTELSLQGGRISDDVSMRGVQGAVSAGYDFQLGPRWVLGIFADYAFGEVDGNIGQEKHVIDKQWAIGSRIGLLATPSTLLYASGAYLCP